MGHLHQDKKILNRVKRLQGQINAVEQALLQPEAGCIARGGFGKVGLDFEQLGDTIGDFNKLLSKLGLANINKCLTKTTNVTIGAGRNPGNMLTKDFGRDFD